MSWRQDTPGTRPSAERIINGLHDRITSDAKLNSLFFRDEDEERNNQKRFFEEFLGGSDDYNHHRGMRRRHQALRISRRDVAEILVAGEVHRIVIDETYIEYVGSEHSLETLCATHGNLMVIKSMSKVYGLSGLRVGYAVVEASQAEAFNHRTPPYMVSTLGQMAAITALNSPSYYEERLSETHRLREALALRLADLPGVKVIPSVINALVLDLAESPCTASHLVAALAADGLLCRDISSQGVREPGRYMRLAVLDDERNQRSIAVLKGHLQSLGDSTDAGTPNA